MTRDQIILGLQRDYALRREENHRHFEQRCADACSQCPGLSDLLSARKEALMAGIRHGITAIHKNPQINATLSQTMALYNEKIAACLSSGGLSPLALQPVYTCSLCRDEGYIYEPIRHMCACFETELNRRMLDALGLTGPRSQTFEAFDEKLFSQEPVAPYGVSQRQMMLLNRNIALEYADTFPNTPTRDLLLIGQSGLGKTYLLHSIAHRLVKRGFLPLYLSAYRLFEIARKSYIDNDPEQMADIMDAPVLLLDDLGTEPLMNNITVTQLFALLNERQMAGLHTVISTNLTLTALKDRYTERVTSRLLDSRDCKQLNFIGEDIRKNLGKVGGRP